MSRLLPFLLGPELLWALFFIASSILAARNVPATPAGNALLERACTWGPVFAVASTFLVFVAPTPNRWTLLLRVALAVVVGINVCLVRLIGAIDYGDSRNSGVLGFWVIGILLGGVALVPGTIATILLLRRGQ